MRPLTLFTFALLLSTTGCGGCFKPPGDKADSPRGARLKQLYDENKSIAIESKDDLPIRFEPIQIATQKKGEVVFYNPTATWVAVEGKPPFASWLRERVQTRMKDLRTGEVKDCVVRLGYLDASGAVVDSEEITLPAKGEPTPITLKTFANTASPVRATAVLASATWVKPAVTANIEQGAAAEAVASGGKLSLRAPLELPIRFDEMNVDPKDKKSSFPPTARWHVVGDSAALRTLLEHAAERKPEAAGRDPKSLKLMLTYRDKKGQPIGTETVELDLTTNAGMVRLSRLTKSEVGAIGASPVAVTWKEQSVTVPLAD